MARQALYRAPPPVSIPQVTLVFFLPIVRLILRSLVNAVSTIAIPSIAVLVRPQRCVVALALKAFVAHGQRNR